jgi:hypothetical protein
MEAGIRHVGNQQNVTLIVNFFFPVQHQVNLGEWRTKQGFQKIADLYPVAVLDLISGWKKGRDQAFLANFQDGMLTLPHTAVPTSTLMRRPFCR